MVDYSTGPWAIQYTNLRTAKWTADWALFVFGLARCYNSNRLQYALTIITPRLVESAVD